jgi:glucose/arabinose dehydrogenase
MARALSPIPIACLLAACGGGGGTAGSGNAGAGEGGTPAPAPLALALHEEGNVADAVFVTAPPGDKRLFVVERKGTVRLIANGRQANTPFLNIGAKVLAEGEGGLLSMAFDPRYASNGYVYLYYTDAKRDIVVERRSTGANPDVADPASGLEILRIAHPGYNNHFGGQLAFGPDGMLYAGTGDGGGAGDPQGNSQNRNVLLGKLLRIDVSASSFARPYAIPANNPFDGQNGRAEIWALGLRNPWRYSFDGNTLYIADVGQGQREEVDIASAAAGGLNYGWNVMEGTLCYNGANCSKTGLALPAFDYAHGNNAVDGCSITGGYVYRGAALPALAGSYFYSDYCAGYLKSFTAGGAGVTGLHDWGLAGVGGIVSFGRDGDGELYLVAASGKIYKIVKG